MQRIQTARTFLLVAVASLLVSGCGGYVARGRHLYHEGRYIESADVLAQHEDDCRQEPPRRQAEYATYRGLSMLVLGNYAEAHRWMRFAYSIEERFPGSLRPEFRRELDHGWKQLAPRLRASPGPAPAAQGPTPP